MLWCNPEKSKLKLEIKLLLSHIVTLKEDLSLFKEVSQPLLDSLSQIPSSGDAAEREQVASVELGVCLNHSNLLVELFVSRPDPLYLQPVVSSVVGVCMCV